MRAVISKPFGPSSSSAFHSALASVRSSASRSSNQTSTQPSYSIRLGVLGIDRPEEVVLDVAPHAEVLQRELAVLVQPPAPYVLGIEVLAELEQEDDLDHRATLTPAG
jgi:hypothetical protein